MRCLHRSIRLSLDISGWYRTHRFGDQLIVIGAESMLRRLHWHFRQMLLQSRKCRIGLSSWSLYYCRLCYVILILWVRYDLQLLVPFDVTHYLFKILVVIISISYSLFRVMAPHEARKGRLLRYIWRLSLRGVIGAFRWLLGRSCFLLARCAIGAQGFKRGLRIPRYRHRISYSRCIYLRCSRHRWGLLFHDWGVVWELLHWKLMLLRRT